MNFIKRVLYDKNTYLKRKVDLVRTRIIREPYEEMPEMVIFSGIEG